MSSETMLSLNGRWRVTQVDGEIALDGRVPGLVHHDLIDQGHLPEPHYRTNELQQQWVGEQTWQYERAFELTQEQAKRKTVVLNCDGLDTVADVYVNQQKIGRSDNMFLRYRWDIAEAVQEGGNTIRIVFHPAAKEMDRSSKAYTHIVPSNAYARWSPPNRSFLRKAQCHGGWDWGPCFLTQGIYRDLDIECRNGAKILYLTHQQTHGADGVAVDFTAVVDAPERGEATVTFELDGKRHDSTVEVAPGENKVSGTVKVEDPKLWWPNGSGEQHLYEAAVTIEMNGETDRLEQEIGLRQLEVVTEPDEVGESFFFRVNGVAIFAKGANWIPSDSFDSRLSDDQMDWELQSAAKAHHNAVRVWGGGIYERDHFYRTCDKLGLLVWQDFMFACAMYPTHKEFLESVRREARHQVRRLMHHPSIAMWSGNNENEQALSWYGTENRALVLRAAEYDQLYIQTIMPIVLEEDPGRRYWPSSPCNGIRAYGEPNDPTRGDTHYWGVWHGDLPFTDYLKIRPRFCSEFGFQSFASPETMAGCTEPEDRNITSPVFEFHQRSGIGNLRILSHIARHFRIPVSYEDMLYVSQALQAESIRTACEHWRRIKPHNMGTIIWQLNDIWPVASWSSLEYCGRWKMMHYAARRFFAPLLASSVVEDDQLEIWATSDINKPLTGTLDVQLLTLGGRVLMSQQEKLQLPPLASRKLFSLNIAELAPDEADRSGRFVHYRLNCGEHTAENQHFLVPFKTLELRKPELGIEFGCSDGTPTLRLACDTLVPFLWIRHGNIQGTWSDNGMHLLPGRPVTLTFEPRGECSPEALEKSLIIHNLYDSGF